MVPPKRTPEPLPPAPTAAAATSSIAQDLRRLVESFGIAPDALPKEALELAKAEVSMGLGDGWLLSLWGGQTHVRLALTRRGQLIWGKALPVLPV